MGDSEASVHGLDLAIRVLQGLASVSVLFDKWIKDIYTQNATYEEILQKTMQLRSVYEVKCLRVPHHGVQKDKEDWETFFHPFSEETIRLKWEDLGTRTKACLLQLMKRQKTDGFRMVKRNMLGTELNYQFFVYDTALDAYFEQGLGLYLFLRALEQSMGPKSIDLACVRSVLPESKSATMEKLVAVPYEKGKVDALIEELFLLYK